MPISDGAERLTHAAAGRRAFSELRVASVMDTWIVSGPGRQLAALAQALRPHGVRLRIYMFHRAGRPPSPFVPYLERAGVEYQVIEDRGAWDMTAVRKLRRELRRWDPAIVQSHGFRPTPITYLLSRAPVPWSWISFFHGDTDENWKVRRLYNPLHHFLLPRADRVVVLSEEHRRSFERVSERVRLIYNASLVLPRSGPSISLDAFRRPSIPVIGVLARLSREKGVDVLLDALAHCVDQGVDATLIVAGDGPELGPLQAQAVRLRLDVHFLGRVEDVAALYPQLDLVVIPSRAGAEGLPNVLLEALRADVPVVATEVAAVPEVLADPSTGEMPPPGDPEALADAIVESLRSGKRPGARASRRAATERFSLENRVERHLELYAELRPDYLMTEKASEGTDTANG